MERVIERLILDLVVVRPDYIVGLGFVGTLAIRVFLDSSGEKFVGDSHLHVVGFTGKHGEGLVLCLPAKAGNGSVIAAAVGMTGYSKRRALQGSGVVMREDFTVLDRFNQSETEHRQRNTKREIARS